MTKDKETIEYWIETVNTEGKNLSKWEEDFMKSITEQFEEKKWLSDKQEDILERIYAEKTS